MFKLTKEGQKYRENGLPEKKLVELLEKGSLSLIEAKKLEDFSIAIQWAKKNRWVTVEDNKLTLLNKPSSFPEQDALNDIKSASQKFLKIWKKETWRKG